MNRAAALLYLLSPGALAGPDQPWREPPLGISDGILTAGNILLAVLFFAGLFWLVDRIDRWRRRNDRRDGP